MTTDDQRIEPHRPLPPAGLSRAPSVLHALGLILLYFLLQILAGVGVSFVVGLVEGHSHPGMPHAEVRRHVLNVLQQADSNALLVIVALPLIALILLALVHRRWPALWSMTRPPGFGFVRPVSPNWYAFALLIGIAMPPLGGAITQLLAHGHKVTQNVEELSRQASWGLRVPLAIVVISVGPIVEEFMFRGVLLSALMRRWSTGTSVALCAVLFGVVHLEGLAFQWYALPNLILLAIALCWLRLKSGSLWPAILAHGLYNLFALIALFAATPASGSM